MSARVVRMDTVRHKIGECPSCRDFIWAEVTLATRVSEPAMVADGKASVYATASPFAASIPSHECAREDEEAAAMLASPITTATQQRQEAEAGR